MTKWFAIALSVVWMGALNPTQARAQSTDKAIKQARALHQRAMAELKQKKFKEAIDLWETAMTLHPMWKYAFNMAIVHDHLKRWIPAWTQCRRAGRLGIPETHQKKAQRMLKKAEERLFIEYTLIELKLQPEDATVTIQGKPWAVPRERWVKQTSSRLTITRKGYRSTNFSWEHPIGARIIRELNLEKEPEIEKPRATVRLELKVSPKEATILVGKKTARGSIKLEVKRHSKVVAHFRHKGYVSKANHITVGTTDQILDVTLVPAEMTTRFATAKWVVFTAGVFALTGGIGLFTYNESIVLDDITELNNQYSNQKNLDSADYYTEYDELKEKYDGNQTMAWIMTGVGAATCITALVLFLMDEEVPANDESPKTTWTPLVYPGGIGAQVRF